MGCPITRWYIDRPDALGHVLAHRLGCFGVRFRARGFHCQAHGRRLLALVLLLGRHLCLLGRLCRLGRGLRRLGEDLGHVLPRRRWLVVDLLLLGHLPMTLRRGIGRAPRRLLLPLWLPWDHGPRRLAATARVHRWRVLPQAPVRRAARCGAINFTQRRRRAAHSYTSALAKVRQTERGGAASPLTHERAHTRKTQIEKVSTPVAKNGTRPHPRSSPLGKTHDHRSRGDTPRMSQIWIKYGTRMKPNKPSGVALRARNYRPASNDRTRYGNRDRTHPISYEHTPSRSPPKGASSRLQERPSYLAQDRRTRNSDEVITHEK